MRTRHRRIVASLLVALLAGGLLGACSPVATKGTMPPPGPNGQIDTASAPDYIAVAADGGGIVGYARKADVLGPVPAAFPVFADDLRTVVGQMVPDKGFIPAAVDPLTVPKRSVEVAASSDPSGTGTGLVVLYVRNNRARQVWVAVQTAGETTSSGGFWAGQMAVGCYSMTPASRLVLLDRSATEAGAAVMRVIYTQGLDRTPQSMWLTVGEDGVVDQGTGVPDWWTSGPQAC